MNLPLESPPVALTNCDGCANDLPSGRCRAISVPLEESAGVERETILWVGANYTSDEDGGYMIHGATGCPGFTSKVVTS